MPCSNLGMTALAVHTQAGAAAVATAEGQVNGNAQTHHGVASHSDLSADTNLLQNPDIAKLGTCLQVINQAHRGGEGLGPVPMRATLLKMLHPLLRVQARLIVEVVKRSALCHPSMVY